MNNDKLGLRPAVEGYTGNVFPYRGSEDHGVSATEKPLEPSDWEHGVPVEYSERPIDVDPVPVKIVTEGSRELRRFRVVVGYAGSSSPRQILGQDEERSFVRIKNTTSDKTLYVAHHLEQATATWGYPIAPGDELPTSTQMAIYASTSDTVDTAVPMFVEYATEL